MDTTSLPYTYGKATKTRQPDGRKGSEKKNRVRAARARFASKRHDRARRACTYTYACAYTCTPARGSRNRTAIAYRGIGHREIRLYNWISRKLYQPGIIIGIDYLFLAQRSHFTLNRFKPIGATPTLFV